MFGFSWLRSAATVSGGMPWRLTNSTGSPDFAAHAAAGIAYFESSAVVTTTLRLGLPAATVRKRSTSRASAYGFEPRSAIDLYFDGAAASPTRITCAPRAATALPRGWSASSALDVASGTLALAERRIGERGGWALRN